MTANKHLVSVLALSVVLIFSTLLLSSCGGGHKHSFSNEWSKDGNSHWQACSGCDAVRDRNSHDWNSGVTTLQPTETSEGIRTYTCNTCGQTRIESVQMLEHTHTYSDMWSYNDTHHWHSATCTHAEEKSAYAEHDWDGGRVTLEPTLTSKGKKTYTCQGCSKTRVEELSELVYVHSHVFNIPSASDEYASTPATCTARARYFYRCVCGEKGSETFEYGGFADHKFTSYKSDKNASCLTDGTKTATCDVCHTATDTVKDVGTATGHSYSDVWSSDALYHWHDAICTHVGEMSDRGTHDWDDGVVTKEPVGTEDGEKIYTCKVCNKTKTSIIGNPNHNHSFATEYSSDDNYHWYAAICNHPDEVKDKQAHRWNDGELTADPTVYDAGVMVYTCLDCQHEKEESVDKLPSFTVVFYDTDNRIVTKTNYAVGTASSLVVLPEFLAHEGYVFDGWIGLHDAKLITETDFTRATANEVYSFKPALTRVYKVVFIDYDGNSISDAIFVREGEKLVADNLPAIPERVGYSAKWDDKILTTAVREDITLTPTYDVLTFTVTFLDSKGGSVIASDTVQYGSFADAPVCDKYCLHTKLYRFSGWRMMGSDAPVELENGKISAVYSDMTLYASYEEMTDKPVVAMHIEGTTVTVSVCMPNNTSVYSINMSLAWQTDIGISAINSIIIANPTYLEGQYCTNPNATLHINKSDWVTYNNKSQTLDFVWGCGSGHCFEVDYNTITLNFGVQGFAEINDSSFTVLDGSTIVYGTADADITELQSSEIEIWFY